MVLFLPGISGKAFSERFQPLVDVCVRLNLPIARLSAWEGEGEVQAKTWGYFQDAVDEAVRHLLQLGFTNIVAIGKSFGGGLLLSYHNPSISKKILWAPALGVGETDTLSHKRDMALSEVPFLLDLRLSKKFIHEDPAEICIIHGTKDEAIPLENSRTTVAAAQKGSLIEVPDADHSFKTPKEEQELMEATQQFLSQ